MERDSLEVDVLIVGGGPAGLAAAIHLKQLSPRLGVMVLEKGAQVGSHLLSGALLDPRALEELLPDWQALDAPLETPVTKEGLQIFGHRSSWTIPHALLPACMRNEASYIVSLGSLCRWLAGQAENMGVDVLCGFAASELLFTDENELAGVITGDYGRDRNGMPQSAFRPGTKIHARYTLFAEGSRGHLAKRLESHYSLRKSENSQVYSLGIKELWEIPDKSHHPGLTLHSVGWPLGKQTSGGGFCYHLSDGSGRKLVALGLVAGLGFRNPWFSPYEEFQCYKSHPGIASQLRDGRRIAYGARTLTCGGLHSLPQLTFPGGALIGDDAGFLNAARQKGIHTAMKSGMLAAEATAAALRTGRRHDELSEYTRLVQNSWLCTELRQARNFRPWLDKGSLLGGALATAEIALLGDKAPWTLALRADHERTQTLAQVRKIEYPKPDGLISFDIASSLHLSGTRHEENQPCHLVLKDERLPLERKLLLYGVPEQRYCPAQVYEIVTDGSAPRLLIHAANCLHCKACDIKDPGQSIDWQPPQGGEGPRYQEM